MFISLREWDSDSVSFHNLTILTPHNQNLYFFGRSPPDTSWNQLCLGTTMLKHTDSGRWGSPQTHPLVNSWQAINLPPGVFYSGGKLLLSLRALRSLWRADVMIAWDDLNILLSFLPLPDVWQRRGGGGWGHREHVCGAPHDSRSVLPLAQETNGPELQETPHCCFSEDITQVPCKWKKLVGSLSPLVTFFCCIFFCVLDLIVVLNYRSIFISFSWLCCSPSLSPFRNNRKYR